MAAILAIPPSFDSLGYWSLNTNDRNSSELTRYIALARLFDQAFRFPGTSWRFGLDALLGIVPGAGDLLGALVGSYGIWAARSLGAPSSVQLRMLFNLGVDALLGVVPIIGDLFDFAFKAHMRNAVLLEEWLAKPHATHRSSALILVAIPAMLLIIIAGVVWLTIVSVRWMLS